MKTLFVAPTRNGVGLSSTTLGLVRALERQGLKVAFLKPIAQTHEADTDDSVHFARALMGTRTPEPISLTSAEEQLSLGAEEELMENVIALSREAAGGVTGGADVLVAEGLALTERNTYAGALNASLARNLEAEVILVSSLAGVTSAALADELEISALAYRRSDGGGLAGYILNFAPRELDFGGLLAELRSRSRVLAGGELPLLGVVAQRPALGAPRTLDVARYLGATVLNEGEANLRRVSSTVVTARSVPRMAHLFGPGALVVTPGDREDVVMAAALAHLSGVPLAGLLFTSGSGPEDSIEKLCRAALTSTLPVLRTNTNSYETASRLSRMDARVPHDDTDRMDRMLDFIADRLDTLPLGARLRTPSVDGERRLPPSAFRYELIQKARAANKRIVLPEGDEPRTVRAAVRCVEKGIARCVLLAKPDKVRQVADGLGLTLPDGLEILDPDVIRANYVAPMVELRKSKGMTAPQAEAQLEDTVVIGTTLVSSVFFMLMPEQVLVYGDAAINPNPNAQELADIAIQSADSARAFGITPRVAMLSYSTGESGTGEDVEKVKAATGLVKETRPDIIIDGPLQYDAASVLSVGKQKAPDSPVAGRATVFIFPDLNTGNTTYKAVQRAAGVVAVGPMLQGLRKPVNDLSRGALVDDIVYTIALTAIQSTQQATQGGGK
jgi:phosphate acetyltransferase